MSHKHLATYLNDHLAGAITAVDLLSHVESSYAGSEPAAWAAACGRTSRRTGRNWRG